MAAGFAAISYGLLTALVVLAPRDVDGNPDFAWATPGLYAGGLVQLIAIVIGLATLRRNRSLGMGLVTGVLIVVVVVPFCALVFAMCLALFVSMAGLIQDS